MALKINKITKVYGGKIALNNFCCELTKGVYGFLGQNGAGKTTLMNIIAGNIKATKGNVTYNEKDIKTMGKEFYKILGFMPQHQSLYEKFTVKRFMWYMATLKGMDKKTAKEEIPYFLELVNLSDVSHNKLKQLSGGMKQRVLIAQALLNNPKILMLDEPTAGLDPKERIRIRNFISTIAIDKIVIFATHVVSDIAHISKEVLVLQNGVLLKKDKPSNLRDELNGKVYNIKCTEDKLEEISKNYVVTNVYKEEDNFFIRTVGDKPNGYSFEILKPTLEDVYISCIK